MTDTIRNARVPLIAFAEENQPRVISFRLPAGVPEPIARLVIQELECQLPRMAREIQGPLLALAIHLQAKLSRLTRATTE